jgi:peptidoglycan hydrolase-like protein with peptidoglycan-binding domain
VDKTIMSAYDFSLRMDPCLKRLTQTTSSLSLGGEKTESVELVDIEGEESAPQHPIIQPNPLSNGSVLLKLSNPLAAKIVQSQLAMLGYYQHNIDGKWGKYSRSALSSFKRDNYLGDGSKWDMETQIALFNAQ